MTATCIRLRWLARRKERPDSPEPRSYHVSDRHKNNGSFKWQESQAETYREDERATPSGVQNQPWNISLGVARRGRNFAATKLDTNNGSVANYSAHPWSALRLLGPPLPNKLAI